MGILRLVSGVDPLRIIEGESIDEAGPGNFINLVRIYFYFQRSAASAKDDVVEIDDFGVNINWNIFWQAENCHATNHHPSKTTCVFRCCKREMAHSQEFADCLIYVQFSGCGCDACCEGFWLAA